MTADSIISELLERNKNHKKKIKAFKPYLKSNLPSFFYGTVHAEATLMGLMTYFSPVAEQQSTRGDHNTEILNLDTFKETFTPVC